MELLHGVPYTTTFDNDMLITNSSKYFVFFKYTDGTGELAILPKGTVIVEKELEVTFTSNENVQLELKEK